MHKTKAWSTQQATMETEFSNGQSDPAGPAKAQHELLSVSGDHAT